MTTVRTSTVLPAGTMADPAARRFTLDTLGSWPVAAETRETAELVVSELVGNAVQHADGTVELGLVLCGDMVRIEVVDNSPVLPVMLDPEPAGDRHRGLHIVADLSANWGTKREAGGKIVWAELPTATADRTAGRTTTETTPDSAPTVTDILPASTIRTGSAVRRRARPAAPAWSTPRRPPGAGRPPRPG
ncbi:MAG TPA: ATP-binding protein, partial [Pseudonocardiaceae bacterium]|nr:ATP-binding protein [Pseudonocardiaceae bacterium]